MRLLLNKKKTAVILLLCMILGVMAPAEIASATYYKYGATFKTYSKTATYMQYGKSYKTKKAGYHYYKLEVPRNTTATISVEDYSNKSLFVDCYRSNGSYSVQIVGNSGWKKISGNKYRYTDRWDIPKGTWYFRIHKKSKRLTTFKISFNYYY